MSGIRNLRWPRVSIGIKRKIKQEVFMSMFSQQEGFKVLLESDPQVAKGRGSHSAGAGAVPECQEDRGATRRRGNRAAVGQSQNTISIAGAPHQEQAAIDAAPCPFTNDRTLCWQAPGRFAKIDLLLVGE